MAKGIVITADDRISEQDLDGPVYDAVEKVVGGWVQTVHPRGLKPPFCMCVDDAGLLRDKVEFNFVGSVLYGTAVHGYPIAGTIVLMKEEGEGENRHLAGLSPEESQALRRLAEFIVNPTKTLERLTEDAE